jgi:hypothetical protein
MKRLSKGRDRGFNILVTVSMTIMTIFVLIPFVLLFMSSISSEKSLAFHGYEFFPHELSLDAYLYISRNAATIFRSYGITILVTGIGMAAGVAITALLAYPLSRKDFSHRNVILFLISYHDIQWRNSAQLYHVGKVFPHKEYIVGIDYPQTVGQCV